jgi:hypothetical protein
LLSDANSLKSAVAAERAAKVTLDLTQRQQQVGYVNYLTVLNAQQSYQTTLINLVQAQASRFGDTAALFQALGGGWRNRQEVAMGDKKSGSASEAAPSDHNANSKPDENASNHSDHSFFSVALKALGL